MAWANQQEFIAALEKAGELVRIREFVDPNLEITEVVDRVSKAGGPALLFENTGTPFPLLINALGSRKRMSMALQVNDIDDVGLRVEALFKELTGPKQGFLDKISMLPKLGQIASWMPKTISGRGACQQVVHKKPDLRQLPVMTCWPQDGGPFITLPVIHTRDAFTGLRNVGLYRMQVFGPDLTALHWHRHKVSARHFATWKQKGERMPVAVALGGDPVYTYCGTAPLPDGIDEYMLAGFLRKKRVELVQCLTIDAQVPADADIVIEGYVDPAEEYILEGPFGDHTGYYSLADMYPRFHVTCITHRNNAIYPSTIVGIPPQEDAWIGKATERIFLSPIKMTMAPEVEDMNLPVEGVFHNLNIVKIKKEYPGQALKVMNALWGAGQMMFTKMMIVVSGEVDIHDPVALARHISEHCLPERDTHFTAGPVDVLDHSCSVMSFGGKMGLDATVKHHEELAAMDAQLPPVRPLDAKRLQKDFPQITQWNDSLAAQGIRLCFISVRKEKPGAVQELHQQLCAEGLLSGYTVVIYLEERMDPSYITDAAWRFSNNVDPKRDAHWAMSSKDGYKILGLDGTRKTKALDGFKRDWPNILVSDEATVAAVDAKWSKLGLGPLIPSPSTRYKAQLYPGGAVAQEV